MESVQSWAVVVATAAIAAAACQKGVDRNAGNDDIPAGDRATKPPTQPKPPPRLPRQKVPTPPDVAAPPADATFTESGLAFKVLVAGSGSERPLRNDTVAVHYTGWKTNGDMFYTTKSRRPKLMALNNTAPGWTEALTLMTVDEKRRLWIPADIGFKDPGPGAEMLVFEVELVEILRAPDVPEQLTPPPTATRSNSGLAYQVLTKGRGAERPRSFDGVAIHYTGWSSGGSMFDSSHLRDQPVGKMLFREMPGLVEGIQTMTIGEKKRFWIPEALVKHSPGMPTGDLVYDIELFGVTRNPEPPPVPADVAAPPMHAQITDKGVHYVFLDPAKGGARPGPTDMVTVHYTGWTTDGRMFDSSVVNDRPAQFQVNGVIAGWTEGLQVMGVGDRVRMWIPSHLAYEGNPTQPQGMLVFDVELVKINAK